MKWIVRGIFVGILLVMLVVGLLAADIYRFSLLDQARPADVAIVLGAAVWGDAPSPVFRERINHAIELYSQGTVGAIIFTGGKSPEDPLAESEAARDYSIELRVPAEAIYIETESTITLENLRLAKRIMKTEGFETGLLVSDPLHMKRAIVMAVDLDMDVYSSPTPTSLYQSARTQGEFLLREIYFLLSYYLKM